MIIKMLGISELGDGSRIVKVDAEGTIFKILVPSSVTHREQGKYIQKEVTKDVQFFSRGK